MRSLMFDVLLVLYMVRNCERVRIHVRSLTSRNQTSTNKAFFGFYFGGAQ
jgi:hypothetical protein